MGILMDLIAGDAREILLAIGVDDWAGLRDRTRFPGYVSLGGGMDQLWLDLFAQAIRETSGRDEPGPFSEASVPLEGRRTSGLALAGDRTVERVDPRWVYEVAIVPDGHLDRVAARWIDLIDCEECDVDPEEKPMLRELAGELVQFCRQADGAEDVLFAWSI
jgi:hypothetical protein